MADLYLVEESALQFAPQNTFQQKRLARDERLYKEKVEALAAKEKQRKERDAALLQKSEQNETRHKQELERVEKLRQESRAAGKFLRAADPKVMLIVRIKGVNKLSPRVRKVFQLFRLYQIHNAAFVRINKATLQMLKYIEPFVAYGYPSRDLVKKLICKRGYLRVGPKGFQSRVRICNNDLIDTNLGKYNIRGVEDLVETIFNCGENFKEANNFLWTFKLRSPSGGFVCKRHGFNEFRRGDWGNHEDLIDDLVNRML